MSRGKVGLVARREYFDHLRTKTFWIGICSFPIMFVLIITISSWFNKRVNLRKYAVIDNSGWLQTEVEKRADLPDFEALFRYMHRQMKAGGKLVKKLEALGMDASLADLDDEKIKAVAGGLAKLSGPEGAEILEQLPTWQRVILEKSYKQLLSWWRDLPPKEAEKIVGDRANKSRYQCLQVPGAGEEKLAEMVENGQLFAYIVIGANPVQKGEDCKYVSKNLTDTGLRKWYSRLSSAAVLERRIKVAKVTPKMARWISSGLHFKSHNLMKGGGTKQTSQQETALQYAPMAFVYILWISVFIMAQILMTSTIEEKSNRVIEVLLSSVSPLQLMSGKILGSAAIGLTMVTSWVFFFFIGTQIMPYFMGMPDWIGSIVGNPVYLCSFLVYFLTGYLLYAALLVGIGSVCNSLKEAQNLMQPVMIVLVVPLLAMLPIVKDPNGTLAQVLSFIPPFTPFVMMNRVAGPPETWEYVVTTILLVGTTGIAFWGAAKVFRIGILMTGNPPKLKEIFGWLRAPVGQMPTRKDPE